MILYTQCIHRCTVYTLCYIIIIIFIFKNYPNELHLIRPHWEMRGSRVERMRSNRFETWMAYLTPRHWAITKTYWFFDREWGNDPYYLHCTW